MAKIVFKSEGIISSIIVEINSLGFLNQRDEKSHPLSAIELIQWKILFLSFSFVTDDNDWISCGYDYGRGEVVLAL